MVKLYGRFGETPIPFTGSILLHFINSDSISGEKVRSTENIRFFVDFCGRCSGLPQNNNRGFSIAVDACTELEQGPNFEKRMSDHLSSLIDLDRLG